MSAAAEKIIMTIGGPMPPALEVSILPTSELGRISYPVWISQP